MTLEDWCQAQEADPILSLVITRLRDGMLGKGQSKATDPFEVQSIWARKEASCSLKGYTLQTGQTKRIRGDPPSAGFTNSLQGGCHEEVGHLGLKCMLDLMHDKFFWPLMAAQAKEHVGKCHPCLAFKARQQKVPFKNIMAT